MGDWREGSNPPRYVGWGDCGQPVVLIFFQDSRMARVAHRFFAEDQFLVSFE